MPVYQNATVDSNELILGNCKMETATSVGASFVNMGAGIVNDFAHVVEMYDVQAGNAPDPIEGVASETATITFEMIEYDASVLTAIHGGLITSSIATSLSTINAGGNADNTITPQAFRFTNTRVISGTTVETIITLYKGTLDTGPAITFKSDNDTDPIAVLPASITAKIDGTLSAGSQLYSISRVIVP